MSLYIKFNDVAVFQIKKTVLKKLLCYLSYPIKFISLE